MAVKTYINDIELDYSTYIPRIISFETTDQPVQSTESENIVTHIKENLENFEIQASFTKEDREEKFRKLLELAKQRNLVTVKQFRTVENLIITGISEPQRYEFTLSFTITFRQISIQDFEISEIPLPLNLQQLQKESTNDLQTTQEKNIVGYKYPKVSGQLDF